MYLSSPDTFKLWAVSRIVLLHVTCTNTKGKIVFLVLHNIMFLDSVYLPLPALLNFEAEHQKMQALSTENHHLHNQLASTKQALAEAESTIQKMEARLAQQVAAQAKRRLAAAAW